MPPKLLACIGFLYKVVHKIGRLRKFNRSREIDFIFVLRKKGSKTKERMKEEEIEKGDCGPPTRKVFFWFCRT